MTKSKEKFTEAEKTPEKKRKNERDGMGSKSKEERTWGRINTTLGFLVSTISLNTRITHFKRPKPLNPQAFKTNYISGDTKDERIKTH